MIDMLKNAKDLISKGKTLGDPELVEMGMDLLEQYSPTEKTLVKGLDSPTKEIIKPEPKYVCQNCGHEMEVDKPRKRCPNCKKHKLQLIEPDIKFVINTDRPDPEAVLDALENQTQQPAPANDIDQFRTQVRAKKSRSQYHYDDEGNPDGIIRRTEAVDPDMITNVWQDDGVEGQDASNELLKKFTNVSPRTRRPPKQIEVKCENCSKVEHTHPIHAGGRSRHLCSKCIRRRSQF